MDADVIYVVQVRTDDLPRAKIQLWFAAVPREQAVTAVLEAVPEGWTAKLTPIRVRPEEVLKLKMKPGAVRRVRLDTPSQTPLR
jgi:hypothetical protein